MMTAGKRWLWLQKNLDLAPMDRPPADMTAAEMFRAQAAEKRRRNPDRPKGASPRKRWEAHNKPLRF